MTSLSSNSLMQKTSKKHEKWLERLPQLEGNEAKLLTLVEKCYSAFLAGTASIKDLAVEFNVPVDVMSSWAREGKWLRRREDFRQELLVNVEMEYADFVRQKRVRTAEDIVENLGPRIGQIGEAIGTALELGEYTNVRRLAESLKHVSDIVTRTVGLDAPLPTSDRPNIQKMEDESGGKPAFFSLNHRGPLNIVTPKEEEKKAEVIDVES